MPPFFTVAQCEEQLTKLHAASLALAEGKSFSITGSSGGRSLTRISADELEKMISMWETRLAAAQRGSRGPRIRLVDPL